MTAVHTLIDSANIYVEAQDITALTVVGSATGTYTGSDITNTLHKGGMFVMTVSSVVVTATVLWRIQGKDNRSGTYYTIASVSLDAVSLTTTAGGNLPQVICVYPGAITSSIAQTAGVPLPKVYRVQASVTLQASSTATGQFSMGIGISKIL